VSVACSNSVMRVSCQSCLPNRNGELALEVELHAGAGGFGRDAVGVGEELLGAVDRDPHVLAAGREYLLVEHPVALVGRHGALVHVVLGQRRQDADHDQVAADRAGLRVRGVEVGADFPLQVRERVAVEVPRRHVDLQVELPDLGRPGRIRDRVEHVGVAHRGHAVLVDQVQLDLLADRRQVLVEQALAEHPGERIKRAPHLVTVLAPVLAADLDRLDVTAHDGLHSKRDKKGHVPL
jgi:hypothetical protein